MKKKKELLKKLVLTSDCSVFNLTVEVEESKPAEAGQVKGHSHEEL